MISNAEVCYFQADADYRRQMGENQSSLKHILSSPAHYLAAKTRRFIPSPVMTIGTATHCKVLEGTKHLRRLLLKSQSPSSFRVKRGGMERAKQEKTILANDGQYRQGLCYGYVRTVARARLV